MSDKKQNIESSQNDAQSSLERYVDAVRRYLPRKQRNDIALELREILRSQVEEEEQRKGQPLSNQELSLILRRYGHPREVSVRYGSRQHLIGPTVFPSYVLSVKLVLWVAVPLALFMLLIALLASDESLVARVAKALGTGLGITVGNLALVTLIFAIIERRSYSDESEEDWDPLDLPEAPKPDRPIARGEAAGSLVGMSFMLCWWLGLNAVLWSFFGWERLPIEWSEVWTTVSAAAIMLTGAAMAREIMGLVRPCWVKPYLVCGILINLFALPVLGRLLRAGNHIIATDPVAGAFAGLLNVSIFVALLVFTVVMVLGTLWDIWKLVTVFRPRISEFGFRN